jgi:predicted component of type VI protein secretion system
LNVEDLNSANGIFWRLNKPHKLRNGDIILMGRQMFRFVFAGQPKGVATVSPGKTAPQADPETGVAELVRLLPGGVEENHFLLKFEENILGRTRGTISFPEDPFLSGQHCSITWKDGGFVLTDLKAQNGTFVGVREKTPLADGDIVLIGHQLLRVTASPA